MSLPSWLNGTYDVGVVADRGATSADEQGNNALAAYSATTISATSTLATQDNVTMLAKTPLIMSEASIGNDAERTAVGWTVRNRMARNNTTRVADVASAYAHNQAPTQQILALALSILQSATSLDPTNGATHFYSPRTMPKEGDNTDWLGSR